MCEALIHNDKVSMGFQICDKIHKRKVKQKTKKVKSSKLTG